MRIRHSVENEMAACPADIVTALCGRAKLLAPPADSASLSVRFGVCFVESTFGWVALRLRYSDWPVLEVRQRGVLVHN